MWTYSFLSYFDWCFFKMVAIWFICLDGSGSSKSWVGHSHEVCGYPMLILVWLMLKMLAINLRIKGLYTAKPSILIQSYLCENLKVRSEVSYGWSCVSSDEASFLSSNRQLSTLVVDSVSSGDHCAAKMDFWTTIGRRASIEAADWFAIHQRPGQWSDGWRHCTWRRLISTTPHLSDAFSRRRLILVTPFHGDVSSRWRRIMVTFRALTLITLQHPAWRTSVTQQRVISKDLSSGSTKLGPPEEL